MQPSPDGIAQAFLIGREFLAGDGCCLALGDNIFFGHDFVKTMQRAAGRTAGATVFAYAVHDPERYGVVEFDAKRKVISLEEKPLKPKSRYAVTGIYFYDGRIVSVAEQMKVSARGELGDHGCEPVVLGARGVCTELLGRGMAWLDTGTHDALLEASNFVQTIERQAGIEGGVSGGDCVSTGVYLHSAAGGAGEQDWEEHVWAVSADAADGDALLSAAMNGRILLVGAQGQVGRASLPVLRGLGDVVGVGRADLDLTDGEKIREMVRAVRPAWIVNAAAYTAVDKAETDVQTAFAVNGDAPGILGEEARRIGARGDSLFYGLHIPREWDEGLGARGMRRGR